MRSRDRRLRISFFWDHALMLEPLYTRPDLYDSVHGGPAKGELAFYQRQAARTGSRVLELACGTGRLTVPLAQGGLRLTGLDRSVAMLAEGRRRADVEGTAVQWVCADMRDFALSAAFDLIFIPINSLCHLEDAGDVRACLAAVRRHLAPGGRLVIDVFNPSLEILSRDPSRWYDLGNFESADGRTVRLSERNRYDRATQVNAITWRFEREGEPAVDLSLSMRQFFPQELDGLVTVAGFRLLAKHGNYGEKPFQSDSRQQVLIAGVA